MTYCFTFLPFLVDVAAFFIISKRFKELTLAWSRDFDLLTTGDPSLELLGVVPPIISLPAELLAYKEKYKAISRNFALNYLPPSSVQCKSFEMLVMRTDFYFNIAICYLIFHRWFSSLFSAGFFEELWWRSWKWKSFKDGPLIIDVELK